MDVTMEKLKGEGQDSSEYSSFTIHIDNHHHHRIHTIVTESDNIASKWLTDVLKLYYRRKNSGESIVVGFSAEKPAPQPWRRFRRKGADGDEQYNLYAICIGAQCLIFSPSYLQFRGLEAAGELNAFFSDPRVIAFGVKMAEVAKKLEVDHGVRVCNAVDVNEVSARVLTDKWELDLAHYDLAKLAKAVLGKRFDVVMPESKSKKDPPFLEKVHIKSTAVDAYLLYLLGNELLPCFRPGVSVANPSCNYLSDDKKMKNAKKKNK